MIERVACSGIGKPVSRLVLGSVMFGRCPQDLTDSVLDAFWEVGGNAVDLGWLYYDGKSTAAVGDWARRRGVVGEAVFYTKGCHPLAEPRVRPEIMESDLRDELERLGVGFIDLFGLHRDEVSVPVGEIVGKATELRDAGLMGALAGSNWTLERVREFRAEAERTGGLTMDVNNPNYSLATVNEPMWADCLTAGEAEEAFHSESGMALWSWSSTGGGWFAEVESEDVARVYDNEVNRGRLARARAWGAERGLKPVQVALAWALSAPFPVWAIVGPQSPEQVRELAEASRVELSPSERAWLASGEAAGV